MADQYLGEIRMFAGNFAITQWAECNGQLLAISTNQALFAIIGTFYGGNGVSTFALPDLRSRVPIHMGQGAGLSNYVIGQSGGTENVSLTSSQMPQHNHFLNVNNGTGTASDPTNALSAQTVGSYNRATVASNSYTTSGATGTAAATAISIAGGSQPHSNIQPYLAVTFLIALYGIFPSRN